MTMSEIETLQDDTRRLPHAADKVTLHTALGVIEIARQLMILNQSLAGQNIVGSLAGKPKTPAAKGRG